MNPLIQTHGDQAIELAGKAEDLADHLEERTGLGGRIHSGEKRQFKNWIHTAGHLAEMARLEGEAEKAERACGTLKGAAETFEAAEDQQS